MFRRFASRTPDSRSSKRSKSKTSRDPPTVSSSNNNHSSSRQHETSNHIAENQTTMRRTNYPRSFDHRSTASSDNSNTTTTTNGERERLRNFHYPRGLDHRTTVSSAHTTTTTNEDRERLRNFLKGAMAGSQVAPPDHKQALMERVLKRSKTMDKKVAEAKAPETKAPQMSSSTASSASTAQTKSNFEVERAASTKSARLTPQTLQQAAASPALSLGRRLERVDANPAAAEFRNRLRKVTTQQQQQTQQQESTSLLDVKTREMIQHRFRQRHTAAPIPPPKITTQEIIMQEQEEKCDDPDLEGYDAFFQTLQNEVHGQHSLVRSCSR